MWHVWVWTFKSSFCLEVHSVSWICRFMSLTKFKKFELLFLQIFFSLVFFFFWNFDNMNVKSSVIIPQVPGIHSFFKISLFHLLFILIISTALSSSSLTLLVCQFCYWTHYFKYVFIFYIYGAFTSWKPCWLGKECPSQN